MNKQITIAIVIICIIVTFGITYIVVNEFKNPGKYSITWNSVNSSSNQLSSGIYFIQLITENYTKAKKLILLQ